MCSYIKEICFFTWNLNFVLFLSHFLVNISTIIFLNVEQRWWITALTQISKLTINVETTLGHRRWIDVIWSTLFQCCFVNVKTTSINVRRLNFHFGPNINVETTLMNVDDQQRCFNVDLFARSYTYNLFKGNHSKESKTIGNRIILLH